MQEALLHFLWRMRRIDLSDLRTTTGDIIEIQDFGTYHYHSGPDFQNAKILIGTTLWAGNVEMHLKASDWLKHQHQNDVAYDNVILHVVLEEDVPIYYKSGKKIPCLELKKRISLRTVNRYQKLINSEHWIPCQHHFSEVAEFTKNMWLDRLLVERLEQKTSLIGQQLNENKGNWEETFYQLLARNFGFKVNALAFAQLAKGLPLITLAKHKSNLFQLEALLFGQSGLLDNAFQEEYPNRLKKEYLFLQKKYQLTPIATVNWRFLRMRPANFPTIRIAQFANLVFKSVHLFSKVLAAENYGRIEQLFTIHVSDYWLTHYVFDKPSDKKNKHLGKRAIQLLVINTIVPILFLYGKLQGDEGYKDKALALLEVLPQEKNTIIQHWQDLGMQPKSAYQTQALIQLKNEYCSKKRCLECSIGNSILK